MTVVIDLVSFYKTMMPISVMGCDHLKPKTAKSFKIEGIVWFQIKQDVIQLVLSCFKQRDE